MSHYTLVLGATSSIVHELCRIFAHRGDSLVLVARDEQALAPLALDLRARGAADVRCFTQDLSQYDAAAVSRWRDGVDRFDRVIIGYGRMDDQQTAADKPECLQRQVQTNFSSAAVWLVKLGQELATHGGGTIAVLGSVAGDRARKPNFLYGATKAALHFVAEGMQLSSAETGVHVVLVKPGPTDTKMTDGMEKSGAQWASPAVVARCIDRGIEKRRRIVYAPGKWRWIMAAIRNLPFVLFRRLNF